MTSSSRGERVLVVDEDPDVLDLLAREILGPMGYNVATASDTAGGIQRALTFAPDLIIASLNLPGLSGKDLLVALRSQGLEVPTLVTAAEGMDADAIQAFRLGAHDYLVKPLREAEVVAAVERAIHEIRLRRERRDLAKKLSQSNRELERRVRELTTLFGLGKTVTSTTNLNQLFDKIVEGSLYVTEADLGWVLVKDENSDSLVLRAQRNLPPSHITKLHKPWDDGVSSLVMLSGEALAIHGEGLAQFKAARFGKAALIAPIRVRDQTIGSLAMAREQERPFSERARAMLEAVADYASIALVNARLFQALEARAAHLQKNVDIVRKNTEARDEWLSGLNRSLRAAKGQITRLLEQDIDAQIAEELETVRGDLEALLRQVTQAPVVSLDELTPPPIQPTADPSASS
jgi:two-component system NtrC family sensor kinase